MGDISWVAATLSARPYRWLNRSMACKTRHLSAWMGKLVRQALFQAQYTKNAFRAQAAPQCGLVS